MCGIAGAYHFDGSGLSADVLTRMTTSLAHRGPDDWGYVLVDASAHPWKDAARGGPAPVGLGCRRLKIVDLSDVAQPMSDPSGRLWLAFNGEVYNYVELRAELQALGHRFRTATDTEVVLTAYAQWGTDCFRRFNGMWALAIYDGRTGELVLSRDRWGVKPLYVHLTDSLLVFGSEVKALLRHPAVPRSPDSHTIFNYVARHYRWVDGGRRSFFAGIEHVRPGHFWIVSRDGRVDERRYFGLEPAAGSPRSDDDVLEQFRALFADAVRIRLRADVPVACMLSGGLDSSSVVCMAARLSGAPITTFSARYSDPAFDEGEYIVATVEALKADGRFVYPQPGDLLGTLEEMLRAHDEPVCTVTWFAHWLVMREVAKLGFPVLLNGHAGDELFAGYWSHYWCHFADLEEAGDPAFGSERRRWLEHHGRDPAEYERYRAQLAGLKNGTLSRASLLTPHFDIVQPDFAAAYSTPPGRPNPFAGHGHLSEALYDELIYETVPATLRPEDRNSMAFSIETRTPFLDYRLAEFAFALPSRFKIRDGLGKWIIREGMRGILPEKVRTRRDKQGMNAPTRHWYRDENRDAVRDVFASKALRERGVLDQAVVLKRFDEHVAGTADHYLSIWQWLNFELWMRQAFDEPATEIDAGTAAGVRAQGREGV